MIITKDMEDIIYSLNEYMEDGDIQYICGEADIINAYMEELIKIHDKINENVPKSLEELYDSFDNLFDNENISSFNTVKQCFKEYDSDIKESIGKNPKRDKINDASIQTIEIYDDISDTIDDMNIEDMSIDTSDYELENVG